MKLNDADDKRTSVTFTNRSAIGDLKYFDRDFEI